MEALLHDLRYALRALARRPMLTLAAVITIGLGIGANTAMFGVVDRLFFRLPAHVVDPHRVVRINVTSTESQLGTFTDPIHAYPRYLDFRNRAGRLAAVAAYRSTGLNLWLGPQAERVTGKLATGSFFSLLGVRPDVGRFFGVDEDRQENPAHVAVLSHEFWRRRFGEDTAILGTTLQLGRSAYTVIGVAPQRFTGIDLDLPDVWLPYSAAAPEIWGPDVFQTSWLSGIIARLRPGLDPRSAAAECTAIYRSRLVQSGDSTATVTLGSVRGAVGPTLDRDAKLSLWLAVMCATVLLIACANVANLLLAGAVQRQREMAVRLALGASRGRLARQLFAESALLASLGGCAALLVTVWVGPVLRALILPDAALGTVLDTRVLLFASLTVLATTVVAGLAPASLSSAPDLSSALKAGERHGRFPRSATRTAMLVGQVSLTLILLAGGGLFVGSLRHLESQHFGFDVDRLIVAAVDLRPLGYKRAEVNALYQLMRERVQALPGVRGASLAIGDPFRNIYAVPLDVPGMDSLPRVESGGPYVAAVTPDYFRTMGTSVRRGRAFDATDVAGAQRVAVVNETMARLFWPGENPIGKCLRLGDRAFQCTKVVGVAEDTRPGRVTDGVLVQYFIPLAQADSVMNWAVTALLVRTEGQSRSLVAAVRREVQTTSTRLPYPDVDPMTRVLAWRLRPWRLGSTLLSVFGALGLLLSAIGLYGVLSYIVSQRTQELGIRIALGARRVEIIELIMEQALRVLIWGVALGVTGALMAGRAIAPLLYGVTPHNPLVLLMAIVLLAAVAAVASYIPASRAARVDPMVALRTE